MSTKFGRLEFSGKKFSFTKSSITQAREKLDSPDLSRSDFWMVWRCHGIPCVHFCFYFYFFCLEAALGQDTYQSDFSHCYGNFFESATSKVTISQLCYYIFSIIVIHSTFKDTLRLKILLTWIKIRANSFIKTLVNNLKRKSTKVFILKMLLCHVLFFTKKSYLLTWNCC